MLICSHRLIVIKMLTHSCVQPYAVCFTLKIALMSISGLSKKYVDYLKKKNHF